MATQARKTFFCMKDMKVYESLLDIRPVDNFWYTKALFAIEKPIELVYIADEIKDILNNKSLIIEEDFLSRWVL